VKAPGHEHAGLRKHLRLGTLVLQNSLRVGPALPHPSGALSLITAPLMPASRIDTRDLLRGMWPGGKAFGRFSEEVNSGDPQSLPGW
jgi:hypothetical protein